MTERDEYELSVLRAVNEMPGATADNLANRQVAYLHAMFAFDHPVLGPPRIAESSPYTRALPAFRDAETTMRSALKQRGTDAWREAAGCSAAPPASSPPLV